MESMAQEGDSEAAAKIITDAAAAVDALTYDEAKTLAENKAAVDAAADIADALAAQRAADAAETPEDPTAPTNPETPAEEGGCPICGATHDKGTIDRLIGVIHRLTALIRSLFSAASSVC